MGICGSSPKSFFADSPFSSRLSGPELDDFSSLFFECSFEPKEEIFVENDEATDYYFILEGEVDVTKNNAFLTKKYKNDALPIPCSDTQEFIKNTLSAPLRYGVSAVARSFVSALSLPLASLRSFLSSHSSDCVTSITPLIFDPIERLSKISFFRSIALDKLALLSTLVRLVSVKQGERLFEEGSSGSSMYIVHTGQLIAVTVDTTSPSPSPSSSSSSSSSLPERTLHTFGVDDVFGEISLMMDIPRTAAIRATQASLLYELSRDAYQKFVKLLDHTTPFELTNIVKARTAEHFRKYKVPFFEAIPDSKYSTLAQLCKIEQVPPNQIIFKEGDKGNSFYIIAHGELKVTVSRKEDGSNGLKMSPAGKKREMRTKSGAKSAAKPKRDHNHDEDDQKEKGDDAADALVAEDGDAAGAGAGADDIELCRMGPGKYFGEIALVQSTPRTATVTTVTRCVILSITKENFQQFFEEAPEAIADFEIKLARYDVQLRSVIYHPVGLDYFTTHLKREFSEENIEFWKEVRDFRHLTYADLPKEEEAPSPVGSGPLSPTSAALVRRSSVETARRLDVETAFEIIEMLSPNNASGSSTNKQTLIKTASLPSAAEDQALLTDEKEEREETKATISQLAKFIYCLGLSLDSAGVDTAAIEIVNIANLSSTSSSSSSSSSASSSSSHRKSGSTSAVPTHITRKQFISALLNVYRVVDQYTESSSSSSSEAASSSSLDHNLPFSVHLVYNISSACSTLQLHKLKQTFALIDKDHSGALEFSEFSTLVNTLHGNEVVALDSDNNDSSSSSSPSNISSMTSTQQVSSSTAAAAAALVTSKLRTQYNALISDAQLGTSSDISVISSRSSSSSDGRRSVVSDAVSLPLFVLFWSGEKANKQKFRALLLSRATEILNKYISDSAVTQVNIKGLTQKEIVEAVNNKNVTIHCFDKAEEEILKLMSADSFSRFKQSPLFQEFLDGADSYRLIDASSSSSSSSSGHGHGKIRSGSIDPRPKSQSLSLDDVIVKMGTGRQSRSKQPEPVIEQDDDD